MQTLISPFVVSREQSVEKLSGMLRQLSHDSSLKSFHPTDGWRDAEERIEAVERTSNIRTDFFSQSADNCRYYYDTMAAAFEDAHLTMGMVRKVLAAYVAWHILHPDGAAYSSGEADEKGVTSERRNFVKKMVKHLMEGSAESGFGPGDVEGIDWAVKIYATYLWGWLGDSLDTSGDFLGKFKRRVFLG